MIYGYCRATTQKQIDNNSIINQSEQIKDRYFDSKIIVEEGFNIQESTNLTKLIKELKQGDLIVVTSLDRLVKSLSDGIKLIDDVKRKGAYIHILNIGIIDDSLLGEVLYNTLFSIDEFEKNVMIDKIQIGKNRAKKLDGFKEGRPKKYTKEQIEEALELLGEYSYKKVEQMTGISKSTLIRAKKEMDTSE